MKPDKFSLDEERSLHSYSMNSSGLAKNLHELDMHKHGLLKDKPSSDRPPDPTTFKYHGISSRDAHPFNYEEQTRHIDSALSKSKTTRDSTLYTGVPEMPPIHKGDENGVHIRCPAYISTSTDEKVAMQFSGTNHEDILRHREAYNTLKNTTPEKWKSATPKQVDKMRHVLKIEVPKGHNAIDMEGAGLTNIQGRYTMNPGEREVLMPRGMHLVVHHEPKLEHNGPHLVAVWNAKIVKKENE
jgi:hypothetical protein